MSHIIQHLITTLLNMNILIVDLDNTLLKTDVLYEMFFSLLTHKPLLALKSLLAIFKGKAKFKQTIALYSKVNPEELPYRQEVLEIIKDYKQKNNKIALVSAADQSVVTQIANYLDLFDYAHGSDGQTNLSGKDKLEWIKNKFPKDQFTYIGDCKRDLAIWSAADKIITVTKSKSLQDSVNQLSITKPEQTIHLYQYNSLRQKMLTHVQALRPHQWIKNILVFIPMIAEDVYSLEMFISLCVCFIMFSLTASSVYLINDIIDIRSDRAHATKRKRPIASGDVKISEALILCCFLSAIVFISSLLWMPINFLLVLIVYFNLSLVYSLVLKRRLVIDICILSILYTLRIVAGAAAMGITSSQWVLVFSGYIFLSLAAMKRQTELVNGLNTGRLRSLGRAYSIKDTPIITMIALAAGFISVLVLALYIHNKQMMLRLPSSNLLLCICPIIIYWITRLIFIAHAGKMNDDPIIYALKDKTTVVCGILVLVIFFVNSTLYG